MILPVAFVALLLCAEAQAAGTAIPACSDWACFTSKRCVDIDKDPLENINEDRKVMDDCSAIIMIRPFSTKKWQVVIESWNAQANEVKLLKDSTELVSCKKDNPKATSQLTGHFEHEETPLKKVTGKTSRLSCQFFLLGDSSTENPSDVIDGTGTIKLVSDATPNIDSTMQADDFKVDVAKRQKCDVSNVKFDESQSADDVVKRPDVQLRSVSCSDSQFKLQYKSNAAYENIDKILCEQTTENGGSNKVYKYKIGNEFKDGEIFSRCHAKACSFCTQPTTPTGKTAPVLGEEAGCKTLTCPKFFKIGDKIVDDKAACVKEGDNKFVWKIGENTVNENTAVECFEPKPCKAIENTACSGKCKLNSGMPSCDDGYELSATFNTKNVKNFTVACDTMTGQLRYTEQGKGAVVLPDDAKFSCSAAKESEEKVATGGSSGVPSPLKTCIAVATVLSLLLIILSIGLWYWRKRKTEAKAAADSKSKQEKGAKDKGEAKQDD